MNYKIIQDLEELQKFIDWLPELQDGQKFYVSLFARRKYGATEGLKADKGQLKRFSASKEQLISKIKKLEVELGSYECNGVKVNQDNLALYITPNPRDMHKAGLKTIQELTKFLVDGRTIYNPQSVALNMIQVTGVKKYFDIDIDFTELGNTQNKAAVMESIFLFDFVNEDAITVVSTRGGFHFLIELDKILPEYKKKLGIIT